jgi:hypothetical protein
LQVFATSGHELIRRLIVNEPILGESDSVAIQNVKLGFVQAVASAQDAVNRLNVAVNVLPEERDNVLVETSHDREGNITVSIEPEAFKSLWNIAYAQRRAFQTLSGDVLRRVNPDWRRMKKKNRLDRIIDEVTTRFPHYGSHS